MIKVKLVKKIDGVEVQNGDTITIGYKVGMPGIKGRGIDSILLTGTVGLVDTYTITYSDGSTFEYNIINGENGQDGKDPYSEAVLRGYEGTEEQFYTDLKTVSDKVDKVEGEGLISDEITSRIFYNADEDTISYTREDGGTREFGKEISDRYTNLDTVEFENKDIVSIVQVYGNRNAIMLTDSTDTDLALSTIGMVTVDSIPVNGSGEVAKIGKVKGINTSDFSEGDVLYVDPLNRGKLINTKPTTGHIIRVGIVVVSHATVGVIDLAIYVYPSHSDIIDKNAEADFQHVTQDWIDGIEQSIGDMITALDLINGEVI